VRVDLISPVIADQSGNICSDVVFCLVEDRTSGPRHDAIGAISIVPGEPLGALDVDHRRARVTASTR
jgi:hypothetical protein